MRSMAAVVFTVLAGCGGGGAQPKGFNWAADVGTAVDKDDAVCLAIGRADLKAGQRVTFVNSSMPQTAGELEVTEKKAASCGAGNPDNKALSFYGFRVAKGELEKFAPAFVLVGPRSVEDVDGDGVSESYRACTSQEGVHLTVWSGKALEGRRRWHDYYYLGYSVEPNCTAADTAEQK